ncbi:MAG: NAD(P)/FAD-dependent oxidoreductase [Acidobacteriia bacterium]|nr:NAD(P)/FAD-dependent oxidoreductase [Terriglobia bacterium]
MGAGPAGLTAAYELSSHGVRSLVLEADNIVGGIARTANYKGYLFDMGGHRFFTKVTLVERIWKEVLGDDFITRPRASRIYYRKKFFQYPLEPKNALMGLGIVEAVRCGLSYAWAQVFKTRPEDNFETWISNRFGKRLFRIFFKTYTEKVWGIPCHEIKAEWAAQRIKDLSLFTLVWNAIRPKRAADKQKVVKTLIHEFQYPRKGPGMMWERTRDLIEQRGSRVVLEAPVEKIRWREGRVESVRVGAQEYHAAHFISTLPIHDLILMLDPAPAEKVVRAADDFHYRDFLTVALIIRGTNLFPDNWIYVHDASVKVGRIQNYNNWSPEMVPDPETTCLGLEYFCSEGDLVWNMKDADLVDLARRELAALGLVDPKAVLDGTVVRVRKAYPVYDDSYRRGLAVVQDFLASVPNLQLVGRNGMHRYNNQDHSMLTAVLAARNIMGSRYNLWNVNVDGDYHESGTAITEEELKALEQTQPMVPSRVGAAYS